MKAQITEGKGMATTIVEAYDQLPWTERTLLKHYNDYPFKLDNSFSPCEYRVIVDGKCVGVVIYAGGRKLVCHGFIERQ